MRVFLAGATGAVGRRLVPQLIAAGHQVVATTQTATKSAALLRQGAQPVLVDGLDPAAVGEAVACAEPDVVIHQMTALAGATSLRRFDRDFAMTNRLRTVGTDNLIAAARAAGVRRVIAQSFTGWPNARDGRPVHTEDDPLDPSPPAAQRESLAAIEYLERAVTEAPLDGVVLRYGLLYGPGAFEPLLDAVRRRQMPVAGGGGGIWSLVHVDDAAAAAVAALDRGSGIYNIVDDEPVRTGELVPFLAEVVAAKPPRHVPVWLARLAAGEVGVSMLTQVRGSSNAKAKRELGWQPRWASWRDGFRNGLVDGETMDWHRAKG